MENFTILIKCEVVAIMALITYFCLHHIDRLLKKLANLFVVIGQGCGFQINCIKKLISIKCDQKVWPKVRAFFSIPVAEKLKLNHNIYPNIYIYFCRYNVLNLKGWLFYVINKNKFWSTMPNVFFRYLKNESSTLLF